MRKKLAAALVLMISLTACDPGVLTRTAPLRTATLAVRAQVPPADPHCDGTFNGSGAVEATYKAGPEQPAVYSVKLKTDNAQNVSVSPDPNAVRIAGPASARQSYALSNSNLRDVCLPGSFTVQATATNNASPPATTVESSPTVNVNAVGFQITDPVGLRIIDNANFETTFQLSCCPGGGARRFKIVTSNEVNIASLSKPADLICAGAPVNFTISGKKTDPELAAAFTLKVRDAAAAGRSCYLHTVQVEGR